MEPHHLGQAYALLAAITWAVALVLFRRCGEKVPPLALNLFKSVVGVVLLALTLLVLWDGPSALHGLQWKPIVILAASGVIGLALADTILFRSLNLIGVGLLSIVDCLYAPFVVLLSIVFLSERPDWPYYLGAGLILAGVVVSSRHEPPAGRSRRQLFAGVLLGALAMLLIAVGIVIVKPVLDGGCPILWATTIRVTAGTMALVLMAVVSSRRRQHWAAFRPSVVWKISIPASVVGAYLAMLFWIAGFKLTHASIASILNQTTVVFALILATVVLKERFTRRKFIAAVLAMSGIVVVALTGAGEDDRHNRPTREQSATVSGQREHDHVVCGVRARRRAVTAHKKDDPQVSARQGAEQKPPHIERFAAQGGVMMPGEHQGRDEHAEHKHAGS